MIIGVCSSTEPNSSRAISAIERRRQRSIVATAAARPGDASFGITVPGVGTSFARSRIIRATGIAAAAYER